MTKREFLDTVFALAPTEANAIMDAFDEYVDSNEPHWIPVMEQPPEVGKSVLICDAYGDMIIWRKCRMKRNFSHLYRMTLTHIEEKIWLNWSGSLMIHRAMQKIFYKKQK